MLLYSAKRSSAIRRAYQLIENDQILDLPSIKLQTRSINQQPQGRLEKLIYQAGYNFPISLILLASLLIATAAALAASMLISSYAIWIYFALGGYLPIQWLDNKARLRASKFSDDYPTVLLAMSSSLKVGHTPIEALQRATQLLPKESAVSIEVAKLIDQLQTGLPRQKVISNFANSYRLPELDLFRTAFSIVLENGGHFAHTLQRLSDVTRDRTTLIKAAGVTTLTMRMTANFLLAITPLLLLIIAMRSDNFWEILTTNEIANNVATVGVLLITASFFLLRKMSAFKP